MDSLTPSQRRLSIWPDADKQETVNLSAGILREREKRELEFVEQRQRPNAPRFRGANLDIQSYRGREFILAGPSETGKTFATLWLLDSLLRETPGAKATLARKVQSTIYGTVLITWQRILEIRQALGDPVTVDPIGGTSPKLYLYGNGSRLWVGGMDHSNKILSGERDFIYINQAEELTLQDWEVCHTRTTGRGAVTDTPMTFGDCNPGGEDHWILKRATLKVFESKHEYNPSLFTDSGAITAQGKRTMETLDSLTGIRKKRLRYGRWVGAEGLFFEEFDPELGGLHVIEPHPIPKDALVWGALDYGFKHPLGFLLGYEDYDGDIEIIWEHHERKWLVPHHCKAIHRGFESLGIPSWRVSQIVAGHDVFASRGGEDEIDARTIAQKFADSLDPDTKLPNGLILEHANIARIPGWLELSTRLGNADPKVNIKPTLRIWNTCPQTIATLSRLVHNPRDAEDVLKINADDNGEGGDDMGDTARYLVMARVPVRDQSPVVAGQRNRFEVM